jgi:hypothetical protein
LKQKPVQLQDDLGFGRHGGTIKRANQLQRVDCFIAAPSSVLQEGVEKRGWIEQICQSDWRLQQRARLDARLPTNTNQRRKAKRQP